MKSMIFAAGLGTRLKPITDTLPKALVPVGGKPLLEHVLNRLSDIKDADGNPLIDGVVVNVHHFAEKIVSWFSENAESLHDGKQFRRGNLTIDISDESAMLLETGGAVHHARQYLEGCGSFLIHNVDIFSNADLDGFASQHRPDALATLLVSERETSRFLLFRPEDMTLVGWHNTNTGDFHLSDPSLRIEDCRALGFSGIHIMSDKVFDLMDAYIEERGLPADVVTGTKFAIMNFYMWASSRQPIYGVVAENLHFLDVGKLDTLEQAEKFFETHR
jgi:NDP-sugar pyrophosphorylase family protein